MIIFAVLAVIALTIFVVRSTARPTVTATDRADVTNAALVAHGQQLYTTRCASCHGLELQGEAGWPEPRANGVMPASPLDESGTAWQRTDDWLFTTIKYGGQATAPSGTTSYMPAFGGGLSDGDIWAVISYIKSNWPADIQAAQPQ